MVTGRILDVSPYNMYSLTCETSSRFQSTLTTIPQTVSWTVAYNSGAAVAVTEGVATTEVVGVGMTSTVLSVTGDVDGEYVYTCHSSLDLGGVADTVEAEDMSTVTVYGESRSSLDK